MQNADLRTFEQRRAQWSYMNLGLFHPENTPLNFDPLKPHFYIVKLGFTGVYIIFFISAQNIDCGYSLEPPRRGGSNEYPQSMFLSRNMKKYQSFYLKIFSFRRWNYIYLNRHVFVMLFRHIRIYDILKDICFRCVAYIQLLIIISIFFLSLSTAVLYWNRSSSPVVTLHSGCNRNPSAHNPREGVVQYIKIERRRTDRPKLAL